MPRIPLRRTGSVPRPTSGDVVAGVTVALVLIPQSLAYAELAGMPPQHGLYVAALAPIAAAALQSSPYLQTGPVAITSLLAFGALAPLAPPGSPEYVGLAGLLALGVGVARVLLGLLRAGAVAYLMSQPVLAGFTVASGLLIASSQLPSVLGLSAEDPSPVRSALTALGRPGDWDLVAVGFAAAALVGIHLGRKVSPLFPAVPLVAAAAIAVSSWIGYDGRRVGDVPSGLPQLNLDLPWGSTGALLVPAVVIALVGFAEPAAIARRYAAEDRARWDPDRELVGQGVANIVAGFGGGYPVGGSFSRTSLGRLAGARTSWSGAVTGLVVLAFLPFVQVLSPLPTAVLGALVIYAVLPLINFGAFRAFWRFSRVQFTVAVPTFVATLALAPRVDLAVLGGIALAVLVHLWRELQLEMPIEVAGDTLEVRPEGVLYFASAPGLQEELNRLLAEHPDARRMRVHLDRLGRVDMSGALALREALAEASAAGLDVEICDVPATSRRIVDSCLADLVADDERGDSTHP